MRDCRLGWGVSRMLPPRRHPADEDGFSLIEVIVAVGIFAIVLTLIGAMMATGMRGILLGKQRSVATQEANRMVELARSLSYENIGLAQSGDPTVDTDPAIVTQSGVKQYLVDTAANKYEPILWALNPVGHPFNPHVSSVQRGSTDLTRYVYVTGVDANGDGQADYKRVVIRVVWEARGTAGPLNEVRTQSFIDENGLVPTGPAGAGGYTPMSGAALASGGQFSVRSERGDLEGEINADVEDDPAVNLVLPTTTGETSYRAVSNVNCTAASGHYQGASGAYGQHSVTATADDDPLTATGESQSESWSGSPADPIPVGSDVDLLVAETSVSSPLSCAATVEDVASATSAADLLPLGQGSGSGPSSATMTQDIGGTGLASDLLVLLAMDSPSVSQDVDHNTVGANREVAASAEGAIGDVHVMQIAGEVPDGLVRIRSFSYGASVTASVGTPSQAPSVTTPTGMTIDIYDPASQVSGCTSRTGDYCTLSFDPSAGGFAGVSAETSTTVLKNTGLTRLTLETSVHALPPKKDPLDGVAGPSNQKTWSAEYTSVTVSTRLKIEVVVDVLLGTAVILTDSAVDMNLGTVTAKACSGTGCV